jgi:hypothetical protein
LITRSPPNLLALRKSRILVKKSGRIKGVGVGAFQKRLSWFPAGQPKRASRALD